MMKFFEKNNSRAKDVGTFIGEIFHFIGKNIFKIILFLVIAVIVYIVVVLINIIVTAILGKDNIALKKFSAWLVRRHLKNLNYMDKVVIKDDDRVRTIGKHPDKCVENKKGEIQTWYQDESSETAHYMSIMRNDIVLHSRG